MQPQIIGISGSPIKNSNTDRLIQAVLERLFSLRHQNGLNRGKFAVVIATGIGRGAPGLEETSKQIEHALTVE